MPQNKISLFIKTEKLLLIHLISLHLLVKFSEFYRNVSA